MNTHQKTRFIVQAAVIAALYAALTLLTQPIAFGLLQFRISEALCVLPFLTPAAVPGLAVGCLLANVLGGFGLPDIVFGTLATLLAALCTRKAPRRWLAPLPPVVLNALIVGGVLCWAYTGTSLAAPYWLIAGQLFLEEGVVCYALGLPLLLVLEKYRDKLFPGV